MHAAAAAAEYVPARHGEQTVSADGEQACDTKMRVAESTFCMVLTM